MKKFLLISILVILLQGISFAQLIDKSVATIKLVKTEAITQKQFQKDISGFEKQLGRELSLGEKKEVLQKLVDEKLVLQAAVRDGITVTDAQVQQGLQQAKRIIELQLGMQLSDDQYKQLVTAQGAQTGLTWEKLLAEVKNTVLVQNYIQKWDSPLLKNRKKPSESDVEEYYEENRTSFITPEMVRIKQIRVITQGLSANVSGKYKVKIDEIYNQITNKGASFDDYYDVYIEGQAEKVGGLYIEVWQRDDEKKKLMYGKEFFNQMFKIKEGSLSTVLKSNVGYHIVQVLEKIPLQILELDDKIPPKNVQTVKDQILSALIQEQALELQTKILEEIVTELKKTAVVKIYEKNLEW